MPHYGILLVLGVAAFVGIIGAWTFQKLRFPQVVGYIVIGLLIGQTGIGLVDVRHLDALEPFTFFALGLIGFLVGGELKLPAFRQFGRQFAAIMLGEGLLAFFLVGLLSGLFLYLLRGDLVIAAAGGIVLGAISAATDPASTVDVLWEYRAKGVLTTALIAVVALDDALAMSLYAAGKSAARLLAGGEVSLLIEFGHVALHLAGALVLGLAAAALLNLILRRVHDRDKAFAVSVCTLFLVIGLSVSLDLDVILASMTLGFGVTNLAPLRSERLFQTARGMSTPIYVLFFVLVGAGINAVALPVWIWGLALLYVAGRTGGKLAGAWLGARWSGAPLEVQRYTGLGLFAQGGVAVGLSIVAARSLQGLELAPGMSLGEGVVATVTATTLMVQLLGAPMAKLAIKLAGEAGRNLTEEDVIARMRVTDAMTAEEAALPESMTLEGVVRHFSETGATLRTVKDAEGRCIGVITFDSLRDVLPDQEAWQWLVASDIMREPGQTIAADAPLAEAFELLHAGSLDQLLVHVPQEPHTIRGVLERSCAHAAVRQRLLEAAGA